MAMKQGFPDWAYYAFAALLILLTLPVYWYFFTRHSFSDVLLPSFSVGTDRFRSPPPVVASAVVRPRNLRAGVVDRVECRNGVLYWHDVVQGTRPVASSLNGFDAARCDIRLEPSASRSTSTSE